MSTQADKLVSEIRALPRQIPHSHREPHYWVDRVD